MEDINKSAAHNHRPAIDDIDFGEVVVEAPQIATLDEARARRQGKQGQPSKPAEAKKAKSSVELRYSNHMRQRNDIAVGGRGQDASINLAIHKWVGTHWQMLKEYDERKEYYAWARREVPGKFSFAGAEHATKTAVEVLLDDPDHDLSKMRGPDNAVIMPTPDGYLHLDDDGDIRVTPTDKSAGMTYCVPARLDASRIADGKYEPQPVPSNSAFGRYLSRFFPDAEVCALLQEACASTLLNRCFERAIVFVGAGANGKSTMTHLLRALHPAHASLRLDQIRGRFGLQEVEGRTLLVASETPSYLGDDVEQALKALISRDAITIENKRETSRTIIPRATLVIAANAPLRFVDRTYGSTRKYLHIPFDVRLADNDPDRIPDYHRLITDNPREMTALLDWLLVGARRLLARGRFPDPPEAVQALDRAQKMQTDTVFAWLVESEAQVTESYETPKASIYRDYRDTVLDGSGKPVGEKIFWQRLREHFGEALQERRPRCGKARERVVNLRVDGLNTGLVIA